MADLYVAPIDTAGEPGVWRRLGDTLHGFTLVAKEAAAATDSLIEVYRGFTVTATIQLTPAQAHEWAWWMRSLRRTWRRPAVIGPRPLAYGCLPASKHRRRRSWS